MGQSRRETGDGESRSEMTSGTVVLRCRRRIFEGEDRVRALRRGFGFQASLGAKFKTTSRCINNHPSRR